MQKILVLLLICFLSACQNQQERDQNKKNTPVKISAIQVNTARVKDTAFYKVIIANGIIEAKHRSEMRFRQAEVLDKIYVQNGDQVKKGQKLAQLNLSFVKNNLLQDEVNLATAENKMLEMKAQFGVSNKHDSLIRPEVLANIKIRSGLREAQTRLQQTQLAYEQSILKADFDGVVANIHTKEGNYMTSSEVFCTLISQNNLNVVFNLIENELNHVEKEMLIEVKPFSQKDKTYTGKITEINPFVDKNGLVRVKAHINKPDQKLYDGMNLKVFIKKPLEDVLVIPKSAVVLRSNREVVFTLQDNLAKWNYVKIKDQNTSHYAISEGLKPSDTIIISNNINLSHDAEVKASFKQAQN